MKASSATAALRVLRDDAIGRGVPAEVAIAAGRSTGRWLSGQGSIDRRRLRAYYWGTVRRLAFEGAAGSRELRRRYVVASLVQDLRSAGVDEGRIRDEVTRYYGEEAAAGCTAA